MNPTRILAIALLLGASLAGCGDDPAPQAPQLKRTTTKVDPFQASVQDALLRGAPADIEADFIALRAMRATGQQGQEWPTCEDLTQAYEDIANNKTLVGVQDALAAAQVDDHVLCDEPAILPAARAAAEAAIGRIEPDLPAGKTMDFLAQKPRGPKMDACWLEALRTARMESVPYTEAYQQASTHCKAL